jgi:hypothetical protein
MTARVSVALNFVAPNAPGVRPWMAQPGVAVSRFAAKMAVARPHWGSQLLHS